MKPKRKGRPTQLHKPRVLTFELEDKHERILARWHFEKRQRSQTAALRHLLEHVALAMGWD
jgi:hypothetical protein